MSDHDPLRGGLCVDLPPQVFDKYFLANGHIERFNHYTARTICGRCAVRAACLTDAIGSPTGTRAIGVRGGETAHAVMEMRRKYVIDGVPLRELVALALEHQKTAPNVGDFAYMREGRMPDAELAVDR